MIGDTSMKDTATCAAVERKGVSRWCPSMEGLPSISLAVRLSINARCTTRASARTSVCVCAGVCVRVSANRSPCALCLVCCDEGCTTPL